MLRRLTNNTRAIASHVSKRLIFVVATMVTVSATIAEPIVTNEQVFYVPFNVPVGNPESLPKHIELFVSGDRGATWQPYQKRGPKEGRFTFHAGGDGVYYFATRSINQNGQAQPAQIENAELIVVVDRTQPTLKATASAQPSGQVALQWESSDTNLAPDLFTVKYRKVGDEEGPWHPTDVRGNSRLLPDGRITGSVALWPPAGCDMLQVQVTTTDRAGNTAVFDRELKLNDAPASLSEQPPTLPLLAAGSPPTAAIGPVPPTRQTPDTWPSNTAQHAPAPHRSMALDWSNPGVEMQPQPPVANGYPSTNADSGLPQLPQSNGPNGHAVLDEPSIDGPSQTGPSREQPGPSGNFRLSKSRRFHLEYDIESGDDVDVYRVEVWATDDGGRTWQHLGDDEDRVSPYLVDTRGDGMYGFRLIVQSKEGLAARPPQNGDPADVWIRVDATAPATRLTSARFGRGEELGMLQITWDVRDEDLSDQPVTLEYSSEPNGPWRSIARDLPNTGRYDWRVDDRTPARIYLRVEAADRAGNIGTDQLRDPIKTESLSPKGFIRGIRPAAHKSD